MDNFKDKKKGESTILKFIPSRWEPLSFYENNNLSGDYNYFHMSNGNFKEESTYEAYGAFIVKDMWIIHGHETITAYDKFGDELNTECFR